MEIPSIRSPVILYGSGVWLTSPQAIPGKKLGRWRRRDESNEKMPQRRITKYLLHDLPGISMRFQIVFERFIVTVGATALAYVNYRTI